MTVPPYPTPPRRTARDARSEALEQVPIMLWDALPLVVGLAIVAAVHAIRAWLFPAPTVGWLRVIDDAVRLSELGLLVSLVGVKVVDVVGELGEALGIAFHRMRHAWKTGRHAPRPPRV